MLESTVPTPQAQLGIGERILRVMSDNGPGTALRFLTTDGEPDSILTYADLRQRAWSIATQLIARGAARQRVLLLLLPGPDYVTTLLGCLFSGSICVPAYPPRFNRRMQRLECIVQDSQARFAIGNEAVRRQVERKCADAPALAALEWLTLEALTGTVTSGERANFAPTLHTDLAVIQYTSGSTADPKGVRLTQGILESHCLQLIAHGGFHSGDRCVSWLPPYHDMGLIGAILTPLCLGAEAILMSPFAFLQQPLRWLEAVSRYRATASAAPNFAYELCARRVTDEQLKSLDLGTWRVAYCGAERVRAETTKRFAERFAPAGFRPAALTPCYGMAEATLAISMCPTRHAPRELTLDTSSLGRGQVLLCAPGPRTICLVSSGPPLPGLHVEIVDPSTLDKCQAGIVGEVWVAGDCADGYWNRPSLTEATFCARLPGDERRYLRTGDLGFLNEGELFIAGRTKDLIILSGTNYYPEDLETAVSSCHLALRPMGTAAFAVEHDDGERLILVQEIDGDAGPAAEAIENAIRAAILTIHDITPFDIMLVPPGAVPKTSSGKVQRSLCRKMYLEGELKRLNVVAAGVSAEAADTEAAEARIAKFMAELLGVGNIEPTENFFNLGGHSLLALQLASRLRDDFGVEFPLDELFKTPTARQIAKSLRRSGRVVGASPPLLPGGTETPTLSFSQERMWFLHELDPTSAAYNVAGALKIEGPLDHESFTTAFNTVLLRHSILSSNFSLKDGQPTALLRPAMELTIPVRDFSGEINALAAAISAASRLASLPFDVERDLLVRVELYRVGVGCHVVAASMQHLVTDAWSIGLILGDVLKCYHALCKGDPPPATPEPNNHQNFARWQRAHLTKAVLERESAFWRAELAGAQPLQLPKPIGGIVNRAPRGDFIPMDLPEGLLSSLRDLATAEGATLFMVMLAAFDVALYRYSGQSDVVVGVPVANRNFSPSENFVGTLVNTLAIRARLEPAQSFLKLLRNVRDKSVQCFMHQELPFERVVADLAVTRAPGTPTLIQVMFDFQNTPMPCRRSGPLNLQQIPISRGAAQFDLSLIAMDTALGFSAGIEFSCNALDEESAQSFSRHYLQLLRQIVVDPTQCPDDFDLLTEGEATAMLAHCRNTVVGGPARAHLLDRIDELARTQPDAVAVADIGESVNYRELAARVHDLAVKFAARGLGSNTRACVLLERDSTLVIVTLAILRCGAAYVPLDPTHPQARIGYVLHDCCPTLVITQGSLRSMLPDSLDTSSIVELDGALSKDCSDLDTLPRLHTHETDAAYILYTSGSTGKPKGVEISVGALHNFLYSMWREPGIGASDTLLSVTTIAFDIAGLELFLPLLAGSRVFVAPSDVIADGHELRGLVERLRPTLMQGTPATWTMLLDAGFLGHKGLRVLCGGEALSPDLARRLLACCDELWNMYGPTETTIWSTIHRVNAEEFPVAIGKAIDDTSVYILNPKGRLCPHGVIGEIFIGGAGVANGYWNRTELTAERFVPDPFSASASCRMYRTGDLGRVRRDGYIEHCGRIDFQIKVRGFRIEPIEVETAIRKVTGLHDVLVLAHTLKLGDARLVAYLLNPLGATFEDLPKRLRALLPDYMIPSAFLSLTTFPLTPNGKVDRSQLPMPHRIHCGSGRVPVAPRNTWEELLLRIFCDALGTEVTSVHDDFFLLGGHSLLAVKLIAGIEREFKLRLPLAAVFESPNVAALAQRVESIQQKREPVGERRTAAEKPAEAGDLGLTALDGYEHLTLIRQGGRKVPLFCVHGAGGHVLNFAPLARRLDPECTLYGLQASGIDGLSRPVAQLQEAARQYVAEVRRLQPHGPYHIIGYCVGGLIAVEMAYLLRSFGETVSFVGLINTYRPGLRISHRRLQLFMEKVRSRAPSFLWRWFLRKAEALVEQVSRSIALFVCRLLSRRIAVELRDYWLTLAFLRALKNYRPSPYHRPIVLFRARDDLLLASVSADLGWHSVLGDAVNVHLIPGDHASLMREPEVQQLGLALERELAIAANHEQQPSAPPPMQLSHG